MIFAKLSPGFQFFIRIHGCSLARCCHASGRVQAGAGKSAQAQPGRLGARAHTLEADWQEGRRLH